VLRARAAPVDGLLALITDRIDADLIDGCPDLRVISNYAVGSDNVDLRAAGARGIPVGITPDVLTEATADLTFALLLGAARRIGEGERYLRAGQWTTWSFDLMLGTDVHGKTLGIIGPGRIGRAVARRAEGFGMRVLFAGRDRAELDRLLAESDFVAVTVPLSDATRHLIGAAELATMKRGAILVNTSRGPVVDEQALAEALASGHLGRGLAQILRGERPPNLANPQVWPLEAGATR
jgi:glyoxylate reductase